MLRIGLVLCGLLVLLLWTVAAIGKEADKQIEKIMSRK